MPSDSQPPSDPALASVSGSAASSNEPKRDDGDCAPYWLCYGMAQYLTEIAEPCERAATGDELCHNTADCITEWCAPCAAKAWLEEQKRISAPLPPNAEVSDRDGNGGRA